MGHGGRDWAGGRFGLLRMSFGAERDSGMDEWSSCDWSMSWKHAKSALTNSRQLLDAHCEP